MKFLVVNQPLSNRGDESAHRAFIADMQRRFPSCDIEVFLINMKDEDIALFRVEGVTYTNMQIKGAFYKFSVGLMKKGMIMPGLLNAQVRMIYKKMRSADWVICAPGGMDMGGFRNWLHLYLMRLAVVANKNVAYFARSIGPFSSDLFSRLSADVLRRVKFLSLRDKESYDCAMALGAKPIQTLDSAFLCRTQKPNPFEGRKYCVFVPNSLNWHVCFKSLSDEDVAQFYRKILLRVAEKYPEMEIVMLPQLCGSGNDAPFFKRVSEGIARVVVEENTADSDTQQAIVGGAAFVIGARYHSIVFAINNAAPFVALSYEHKIKGLLGTLGLGDRLVPLSKDDLNDDTVNRVLQVLSEPCPDKSAQAENIARKGINALYELI